MVASIQPQPEFIAFPGDAIKGYTTDYHELQKQWDYWQQTEMKWLEGKQIPLFQSTSNHNTYDDGSENVFRKKHPEIPQNGPEGQKGLAYYIRRGDLLYISTHQPDRQRFPKYRPGMLIDWKWLDHVLTEHQDAKFKLVAGHYPAFPVNGYIECPLWCLKPAERRPFWEVLVRHRVNAYLASHVIAFDVQIHDGIPQIVSGGAGTNYGPGGFMPGLTEYFHAVQITLDHQGLQYQVLDVNGKRREWLQWPFTLPTVGKWQMLESQSASSELSPEHLTGQLVVWRFRGESARKSADEEQTLLCGFDKNEPVTKVWIGLEGKTSRLIVRLLPESTYGMQSWIGPQITNDAKFDFQLALHPGMGSGGILWRSTEKEQWVSLYSKSAKGTEELKWPTSWVIGRDQTDVASRAFRGKKLVTTWTRHPEPMVVLNSE
tara:strand:- start:375 stop:1667 length:1293 start_codon:yes stop_codon:yes gene_type:complete